MKIYDYTTASGKNVILEYILHLPNPAAAKILNIRQKIHEDGLEVLLYLNTRQLRGKVYEIKIDAERIAYVLKDQDAIYFLHIFRKQKGKTERQDIEIAMDRAMRAGLL